MLSLPLLFLPQVPFLRALPSLFSLDIFLPSNIIFYRLFPPRQEQVNGD